MTPKVLFEDDSIVVIDKPGGVVVNDAKTVRDETIQQWFANRNKIVRNETEFGQKQGIVHRLDKETSGVMVLAKHEQAYEKLKQQFMERKTVKKYVALVHGTMQEDHGLVSLPIERNPQLKMKYSIGTDLSRMAITEWNIVKKYQGYTLVELLPHTGRTHQLRVHLQHLGHPIVSDLMYGWRRQIKDDLTWCPRLFLHAKYLEFTHPVSGVRVHFEAELPEELKKVLTDLEKVN